MGSRCRGKLMVSTLEKTRLRGGGSWSYLSPGPVVGAEHPLGPLPVVQPVIQGSWAGECLQGWAQCPFAGNFLNGNSGYCYHLWKQKPK